MLSFPIVQTVFFVSVLLLCEFGIIHDFERWEASHWKFPFSIAKKVWKIWRVLKYISKMFWGWCYEPDDKYGPPCKMYGVSAHIDHRTSSQSLKTWSEWVCKRSAVSRKSSVILILVLIETSCDSLTAAGGTELVTIRRQVVGNQLEWSPSDMNLLPHFLLLSTQGFSQHHWTTLAR